MVSFHLFVAGAEGVVCPSLTSFLTNVELSLSRSGKTFSKVVEVYHCFSLVIVFSVIRSTNVFYHWPDLSFPSDFFVHLLTFVRYS